MSWGHSNHLKVFKLFLTSTWSNRLRDHPPTLRSTHLCGAQALPITRVEDEALFAGDGADHVPWAIRGAVEGGSVSKQRPRAASRSCTGTMDTAMEEKREEVSKQVPGLLQQGGVLSGWHLHGMLSRSQTPTEMHTYPTVPVSSRSEVS